MGYKPLMKFAVSIFDGTVKGNLLISAESLEKAHLKVKRLNVKNYELSTYVSTTQPPKKR